MGNVVAERIEDGVIEGEPVVTDVELISRLSALPERKLKNFGRYLDFLANLDNGEPVLYFAEKDS